MTMRWVEGSASPHNLGQVLKASSKDNSDTLFGNGTGLDGTKLLRPRAKGHTGLCKAAAI